MYTATCFTTITSNTSPIDRKKERKKKHTDYQSRNHSNIKYYMKSASYYGNEYVILNNKRMGPT
ncbi:hypothetical protein JHK82_041845 [Glycine max]|nr:hypothetical protein JHK82_041845 [Glycine max]